MRTSVLYEDEHLLVVNKPPGLAVQPCESQPSGTLLHGVLHHLLQQAAPRQQDDEEAIFRC